MARSDKVKQLEEHITTAVQGALTELRKELDQRLEQSTQALREQLAGLETALPASLLDRGALEQIAADTADEGGGEPLAGLRDGLAAIDRGGSQAAILEALVKETERFASRALLLLTREDGAVGWGGRGFTGAEASLSGLDWGYGGSQAWASLQEGRGTAHLSATERSHLADRLAAAPAEEAILVPIILRDRLAAALYADRTEDRAALDVAGVQSLAYVAALALELLAFRQRGKTPTLYMAEDAGEPAALPLWSAPPAPAPTPAAREPEAPPAAQAEETAGIPGGDEAYGVEEGPLFAPEEPEAEEPYAEEPGPEEVGSEEQPLHAEQMGFEAEDGLAGAWGSEGEEDVAPGEDSIHEQGMAFTAEEPGFELEVIEDNSLFDPGLGSVEPLPDFSTEDDTEAELLRPLPDAAFTPAAESPGRDGEPESPVFAGPSTTEQLPALSFDSPEEADLEVQPPSSQAPPPPPIAPTPDPPPAAASGAATTAEIPGGPDVDVSEDATVLLPRPAAAPAPEPPPPVASGTPEVKPPSDMEGPGLAFSGKKSTAAPGDPDSPAHEEGRRLARLLVSEIRLYNEEDVEEGRRNRDIYSRLQDEIDRSRKMYNERIAADVRGSRDYFTEELVRILADGDRGALGM